MFLSAVYDSPGELLGAGKWEGGGLGVGGAAWKACLSGREESTWK